MSSASNQFAGHVAPATFVLLWSTGFIGTKYVINDAEPLTYLGIRMANRWLGERVTTLQWAGLLLGVAGTVLVLHNRSISGDIGWGFLASGVSLVSITIGTLYQKRYCSQIDWRSGNLVQFAACAVLFGIGALIFEQRVVNWSTEFVLALMWLSVALSIGSIGLFYWLIRRSAATQVASLFYLVPAVTAVMAFVLFDERLDPISIIGMLICAGAVVVVNFSSRATPPAPE